MVSTILAVLAALCFLLAAVGVDFGALALIPLGLFLWVLAALTGGLGPGWPTRS